MLCLKRFPNESIEIVHAGETLVVHVVSVTGIKVLLGFDGPQSFRVLRSELNQKEVIDGVLPAHDGPESRQ